MPASYRCAGAQGSLSQCCGFSSWELHWACRRVSFPPGGSARGGTGVELSLLLPVPCCCGCHPFLTFQPGRAGFLNRPSCRIRRRCPPPTSASLFLPPFCLPCRGQLDAWFGLPHPALPPNPPLPWLFQLCLWQVQPEYLVVEPTRCVGLGRAGEAAATVCLNGSGSLSWWGTLWLGGNCLESQRGLGLRFYFSEAAECGGWWESGPLFLVVEERG